MSKNYNTSIIGESGQRPGIMTRQRRTRILVDAHPELAKRICSEVEALCELQLISGPRQVLVMNKLRESAQNSLFYLGEALLTECKVGIYVEACANVSGPGAPAVTAAATAAKAGVAAEAVAEAEPGIEAGAAAQGAVDAADTQAAPATQPAVGIGLILGADRDRAFELAVIDAVFSLAQPLPEPLATSYNQWLSLLEAEEQRLAALRQQQRDKLEATRVEFDSMLTEDDIKDGANG